MIALATVFALGVRVVEAVRGHGPVAEPPVVGLAGQGQAPATPTGREGESRSGRGVPGAPEPRAWWRDPEMARELGLTPTQISKLNRLYEQRQKQIQPMVDEYKRLKTELDQMFRDRTAKPEDVEMQARRLTYPQMEVVVSRVRLLYDMSRVITPDQNQKLQAIFDRERREQQERGRGRGPVGNLPHP